MIPKPGWIKQLSIFPVMMAFPAALLGQNDGKNAVQQSIIAENVMRWQRSNGGWPKDTYVILYDDVRAGTGNAPKKVLVEYSKIATKEEIALAASSKEFEDATIDNGHTVKEIRLLLQAYRETENPAYLEAAKRGIDYLFSAQYGNGGWPMFYPDKRSYKSYITFNDDAMVNVLDLLLDISRQINDAEVLGEEYRKKAAASFDEGISIILKLQLNVKGKPAVWCAQYDPITLKPAKARSYELPSLSGAESVGIVELLMRIENPSQAVRQAIDHAVDWFKAAEIKGYRMEKIADSTKPSGRELVLVPDKNAVLWARFYDLESNQPFFCDRDGKKKQSVFEIGNERRTGYSWYGVWAEELINLKYPAWKSHYPGR